MVFPLLSLFRRRGTGHLLEPVDERDWPMTPQVARLALVDGSITGSAPAASVRSHEVGPKHQGGTQSCTGMAVSQAVRTAYHKLGQRCPELSALAAYHWGRAWWGGQHADTGSYLRTTIAAIQKLGCPSEEAWPFATLRVNQAPKPSAVFDAAKRRGVRGYYRITPGDIESVRQALSAGLPVVAGFPIDRDFGADVGPHVVEPPLVQTGRHALLVEDYERDGTFGILNSYGTLWRSSGRARVSEGYMAEAHDLWAIDVRP